MDVLFQFCYALGKILSEDCDFCGHVFLVAADDSFDVVGRPLPWLIGAHAAECFCSFGLNVSGDCYVQGG